MSVLPVCHPGVAYPGHVYWLAGWVDTATGHLTRLTQGFYIDKWVPKGVYTTTMIRGLRLTFGVMMPTPGCQRPAAGAEYPPAYPVTDSTLYTPGNLVPAGIIMTALTVLVILVWLSRRHKPRGKHHRGRAARDPWRPAS